MILIKGSVKSAYLFTYDMDTLPFAGSLYVFSV